MKKNEYLALDETQRMNRVLKGKMYYASVHTPNMSAAKKFNADPAFSVDLELDDPAELAKAKSYGLTIHDANDTIPNPFVKIKRKVRKDKTPEQVKPQVVDGMQRAIPPSILVGNASEGLVKFGTYWYDTGGGGIGTTLWKIQVLKLVPYVRKAGDSSLEIDPDAFSVEEMFAPLDVRTELEQDEPPFEPDEIPSELLGAVGETKSTAVSASKKAKVASDTRLFDD